MDEKQNPYAPGAGTFPPELSGRQKIVDMVDIALERIATGRPARSIILVGLRGVGKTVLLNKVRELAEEKNYIADVLEAHEGKKLPELLAPFLRKVLAQLDKAEHAKDTAKKALGVLQNFGVSLKLPGFELGIQPATGIADSGDLENDLPDLFIAVGQAAQKAQKPIAVLIDELQYLSSDELSALIMSIHKITQRNLPVIFIGAGLPQILGLAGNSKSYAERLFTYPEIGALTDADAKVAIRTPADRIGVSYSDDAVDELIAVTEKYPYFIQQWAYEAWNIASEKDNAINIKDIKKATPLAHAELDRSFFKVRFDRCTPKEKRYMRALADFGDGQHRSSDIADTLGLKPESAAPVRSSLIKKGMIYSPTYGDTAFTVPRFHDFMKRVMDLD